jgi:hypothetical protein
MTNLIALWPQNRIHVDCFVTISMDITAPFLSDMGMPAHGTESLREAFRERISEEPGTIAAGGPPGADTVDWLERLDGLLQKRVPDSARQQFYVWLRDTYTFVPADRPNWERYESFFFQWSVGMRTREDTAGCFAEPQRVFEAYYAFIPSRELKRRIQEGRRRLLSSWDEKMFSLRRYTLVEEEEYSGEYFDPFGVVDATANRNYFQQFWEYLLPRLSGEERKRLYDAMREYYRTTSFLTELLPPDQLTSSAR